MTEAWKAPLPTGQKMVLLALADNANDLGECYPAIGTIALKCSMSERTVQVHISALEKCGALRRDMRNGRSTLYTLDPRGFCAPQLSLLPPQNSHPTPATIAKTPATSAPHPAESAPITITQPSEPSTNPNTSTFVLPDWIPVETWAAFMEVRKKLKAKGTDYAHKLLVRELERIRAAGHDPVECINTSIRSGWKDVYPPKRAPANNPKLVTDLSTQNYQHFDDHNF